MKGTFCIALIVMFSMLIIPLSALPSDNTAIFTGTLQAGVPYSSNTTPNLEKIKVEVDGMVTEYSVKDYIFGVVAAEMPMLYHDEALKAQAVAAYTFVCYKINSATDQSFAIPADPETAQAFIPRESAREKWGDKADEYTSRLDKCIAEVSGDILIYDGKPILAAYHAISPGTTNTCLDVWGKDLPYLQSRDSFGDKLASGYLSEAVFSAEELTEKLKGVSAAEGEAQGYFGKPVTNSNGYVKSISYCGKEVSGSQISKALELRSACFDVTFTEGKFTFKVKGYGHGVGLSQTGADYMAKQGSSYKEILEHYYKGAALQKN